MLMISASTVVMAQQQPRENNGQRPSKEQVVEMTWQRVAKQLMLSDAQTAKVKPIYMDFLKEMNETMPAHRVPTENAGKQKPEGPKQLSDAEVKEQQKQQFATARKRIDIQEKYFDKLCKELNPRQAQYIIKSVGMFSQGIKGGKFGQRRHFGQHGQHGQFGGQHMKFGQYGQHRQHAQRERN